MLFCIRLPNFVQIGAPTVVIWRHFHFSRCRPRPLNTTSRFVFSDATAFRRSKSISKPNFVKISPSAAEIQLLPVSKYKRPPYWNSTSGFDLDQFSVICMLFCIRLPNFVQIGAPTAKIWRHIHFSRWRPWPLNTTSGFRLVDVTAFRRSRSISKPNSSRYLHRRLRYKYFRFRNTNVHHIGMLLPVSISTSSA